MPACRTTTLVLLSLLLTGGCDDAGNPGGYVPPGSAPPSQERPGGSDTPPRERPSTPAEDLDGVADGEVTERVDPSELMEQLALECVEMLPEMEQEAVAGCLPSSAHLPVLQVAANNATSILESDPRLPGLDWSLHVSASPSYTPGDGDIDLFPCVGSPDGVSGMNAFALQQVVVTMDPLLDSLLESAALWDAAFEANDTMDEETFEALQAATRNIAALHATGQGWQYIPFGEADKRVYTSDVAEELYVGAVSFVLFHELAHSNLRHALFECVIRKGIPALAERRDLHLTAADIAELKENLAQLDRSQETQADIYALTMLHYQGFNFVPPYIVLQIFRGLNELGCQDVPARRYEDCLFGRGTLKDHPPLDERALLIKKILLNGEDLTHFLEVEALGDVRNGECGDGICQADETADTCWLDCP